MSFDGLSMTAVAHELKTLLHNSRVDKIYQLNPFMLVFIIHKQGANMRLLVSANPSQPRIHLTNRNFNMPFAPPAFCMLLRKHLEGNRILSVNQHGEDRLIHISLEGRSAEGFFTMKSLYVELMGKYSNIILVENGIILDSIKRISARMSRVRQVLPGGLYQIPPIEKNSFFQITEPILNDFFSTPGQNVYSMLIHTFSGMGPVTAKEILARTSLSKQKLTDQLSDTQRNELITECLSLANSLKTNNYQPTVILDKIGKAMAVLPYVPRQFGNAEYSQFPNMNEALDFYYSLDRSSNLPETAALQKQIEAERNRLLRKLSLQREALVEAMDADRFREDADLLTSNLHRINKGMQAITVCNYYCDPPAECEVPLDPRLTPSQNAQAYYQKYAKLKRSQSLTQVQLDQTERDLHYIDSLLLAMDHVNDSITLREIREEFALWTNPSIPQKSNAGKQTTSMPYQYVSDDGFKVSIGRNNKQNDYLTLRVAKPEHIWLHTKDIPGAHVIIHGGVDAVTDKTLLEAAQMAAFFSKAKLSNQVPVDYTLCKYVKKPSGAKPGMVIYDHQKTLYVTPLEELAKKLLKSE